MTILELLEERADARAQRALLEEFESLEPTDSVVGDTSRVSPASPCCTSHTQSSASEAL